jgi:hypothetical protein
MRAIAETGELTRRGVDQGPGVPRRSKVVVRRVDAWSVLKFSLLFYFCMMLIFLFALLILYWALGVLGVLDSAAELLHTAGFGPVRGTFTFNGFWIFTRLFLIGVIGVVVWSLVNMLLAVLYNLISDVVGGIEVTLAEKR